MARDTYNLPPGIQAEHLENYLKSREDAQEHPVEELLPQVEVPLKPPMEINLLEEPGVFSAPRVPAPAVHVTPTAIKEAFAGKEFMFLMNTMRQYVLSGVKKGTLATSPEWQFQDILDALHRHLHVLARQHTLKFAAIYKLKKKIVKSFGQPDTVTHIVSIQFDTPDDAGVFGHYVVMLAFPMFRFEEVFSQIFLIDPETDE